MTPALGAAAAGLPSMRVDGQRAVVVGAGRGIGRACALALAQVGAEVVVMSRSREELDDVAQAIAAGGGRGAAMPCDVADGGSVQRAFATLEPFDVLVNAAGTNIPEPFVDVSEEHLDAVLAVNVRGAFLVAQAAARAMVTRDAGGSIIQLSSQMGRVGAPLRTVYCASKHAIEGLTKAMAVELAPHGIRVNAVAPTFIETPLTTPFLAEPAFRAAVEARIPLGRVGQVADVVGAVVFLASPAAALITGTSLLVDGGWTAQ